MIYFKNDLEKFLNGLTMNCLIFDSSFRPLQFNEKYSKLAVDHDFIQAAKSASGFTSYSKEPNLYLQTVSFENLHLVLLIDFNEINLKMNESITEICQSYENIMDHICDGLFIVDLQGTILYINKTSEGLSDITKEEAIGKKIYNMEEDKVFYPSSTVLALKSGQSESVMQTTRTGIKLLATAIPSYDIHGKQSHVITVSRDVTEILHLRSQLEERTELINKYRSIMKEMEIDYKYETNMKLLFSDKKMDKIIFLINKVARSDLSILLLGESGVGKTAIAHIIHDKSTRSDKPFQVINCSAIPENLLESELFGYEKGSFTGALQQGRRGLFELAMGGTVFLDEIGELSLSIQIKLLHVLQEKKIRRIGGDHEIDVDFRLIAATNQDLNAKLTAKLFREDLYYRLKGFSLFIPPLRERKDDIQMLASHFLARYNQKNGSKKCLSSSVLNMFYHYSWPGNVRELDHLIESLCIITDYDTITVDDLPDNFAAIKESLFYSPIIVNEIMPLEKALEIVESEIIRNSYNKYKNTYKIAEVLGISQATAYRKIRKYCPDSSQTDAAPKE